MRPTSEMSIKVSNTVESNGRISLSLLKEWKTPEEHHTPVKSLFQVEIDHLKRVNKGLNNDKLIDQLALVSSILHRQEKLFLKSESSVHGAVVGEGDREEDDAKERMEKIKTQTEAVERGEDIVNCGPPLETEENNANSGANNLIDLL